MHLMQNYYTDKSILGHVIDQSTCIVRKGYGHYIMRYTLYSRLSLSRNRRDPQKQFEISVLRHIRFVVLRKKQFEQPNFTNDYVI